MATAAHADPSPGASDHPLSGGWSATRWEYASRAAPERIVDVVCDLRGSVTLSLTATAFILAFDVAGRGKHSVAGACEVAGDELRLRPDGAPEPERVAFHQSGDTLSLRSDGSGWDFDGTGQEQAAAFVAVLVRL
ncbi:MAG TPA: hypothetical protein VEH62_13025 [Gemmatimonadales bacterium]|nr:hypothetical protein [Gemmatimonadales bacterium]